MPNLVAVICCMPVLGRRFLFFGHTCKEATIASLSHWAIVLTNTIDYRTIRCSHNHPDPNTNLWNNWLVNQKMTSVFVSDLTFSATIVVIYFMLCACAIQAEDKKRKKKKPKLDMHDQQMFIDGPDVSPSFPDFLLSVADFGICSEVHVCTHCLVSHMTVLL